MTIIRNEILHRVLSMTDAGWVTRTLGDPITGWIVQLDHRPAPDNARWALTALTAMRLILWWDVSDGIHCATPTPRGVEQLRAWDTNLLGTPVASRRPLAGLDPAALDAEAERLIDGIFNETPPKDH